MRMLDVLVGADFLQTLILVAALAQFLPRLHFLAVRCADVVLGRGEGRYSSDKPTPVVRT
jgi:hypothetical protein